MLVIKILCFFGCLLSLAMFLYHLRQDSDKAEFIKWALVFTIMIQIVQIIYERGL